MISPLHPVASPPGLGEGLRTFRIQPPSGQGPSTAALGREDSYAAHTGKARTGNTAPAGRLTTMALGEEDGCGSMKMGDPRLVPPGLLDGMYRALARVSPATARAVIAAHAEAAIAAEARDAEAKGSSDAAHQRRLS